VQLGYRIQISEAKSVTDMPFMSIDDPEFWKNCPQSLELISKSMEGTGGGVAYFVMGEPKDNAPTVVALRMAPNWVLPRHARDCYRFEVAVQGTLDVGERVLKVGDVMVSEPTIFYGPRVAGPEGCTTFEIFSNYAASHEAILDLAGSRVKFDVSKPGEFKRMMEAQRAIRKPTA
jgi:anti-sigma factor ChrR (cupin superfamily)